MIYLDNAATTPMDKVVYEAMIPFLTEVYGNPSGKYYSQSNMAKIGVEFARAAVAKLISSRIDEVVFTSGASEGNNFIIKGVTDSLRTTGKHIITTAIEHSSVLEPYKYLSERGWEVTTLSVGSDGKIDYEELSNNIRTDTVLVSIGWGNSEIGTIQDIKSIGEAIKKQNPETFFHVDATQVIGKLDVKFDALSIDALTFSAHKLYGPKGIGAVIVKRDQDGNKPMITPLIHGGDQEMGYRGSTLAVASIVGFGKAAEIVYENLSSLTSKLELTRKTFFDCLNESGIEYVSNSPSEDVIPSILNIRIGTLNNETLIKDLAEEVAISSGSACSSSKPSYVLKAIGLTDPEIRSSVRISFNKWTTKEEIEKTISEIKRIYDKYKMMFG